MDKLLLFFVMFLAAIAIIVGIGALTALPVMLLWNWLMPVLFKLPEIGFFQAWGLMILCGALFKTTASPKKAE